jgi:hypothetical protein
MPEQILDAVAERRRRARATGASAAHVQVNHAVTEPLEGDVAAVLRHGRAYASFEQFLDGGDDLGILGREGFGFMLGRGARVFAFGECYA